jgi:hypothetical protein
LFLLSAVALGTLTGCSHFSHHLARLVPSEKHDKSQMDVARLHERSGKLLKARELYLDLYQRKPTHPDLAHRIGVVATRLGNDAEATRFFQEALEQNPQNAQLLNDMGYAQYLHNELDAAEQSMRAALLADPGNSRAMTNLALVMGRKGQMNESFQLFRQVVGEAKANSNVAYLYAQHGNGTQALDRFNRALTLDSSLKSAANGLLEIAEMKQQLEVAKAEGYRSPFDPSQPQVAENAAARPESLDAAEQAPASNEFDIVQTAADLDRRTQPVELSLEEQPAQPGPAAQESGFRPIPTEPVSRPVQPPVATLSGLCPEARGELGLLVKNLDTDDPAQIKRTVHRIGRLEKQAAPAVPALQALLQHQDGYVRVHAALALWRVNGDALSALPVVLAGLRQPDRGLRSFAASVLGEIGTESPAAKRAVEAALQDHDGHVRLHLAEALGKHPAWTQAATNVLVSCLSDADNSVRWLATYSLADLAPESPAAVSALANATADSDERVRAGAAFALGEIGPAAAGAADALDQARGDANDDVRAAAEAALEQIEPTRLSEAPAFGR